MSRRIANRALAICSGGGHWVELRRIAPALAGREIVWASVYADYAGDIAPDRFHVLPDVTRFNKRDIPALALAVARVLLAERPALIVTTGAFPGLMALILGKLLLGARTVWIDSIANFGKLSTSGRLARPFADLHLTQWEHLETPSGPRHLGAVL
ncbi:UDP-N-acetylglucosamine--LPS N-acetylglucosamine transferase [Arsenicitalea aurantiaca]|uniref:UDP-N-acetylglucosamine--LPS N-acetylglucosamine transferase n=1 Tax=Arsenicitalea aurantiaca TaxID=1783274 RepID=A0A433XKJ1_9HYPH|nr:UDP-N-acetylglucosamine--LPS N-acetylglucosamine transferase [Arsenicitalea aurantiaca]RUT34589.1 UDP-N-acetylglucosamine--LPS N-acetylglucosamine transferase [Arsenicitalea aurantiaca]